MMPEPPAVGTRFTRARLEATFCPMDVPLEGLLVFRFDELDSDFLVMVLLLSKGVAAFEISQKIQTTDALETTAESTLP
jgi:hypothetical protein